MSDRTRESQEDRRRRLLQDAARPAPRLDDPKWLSWYQNLREDRVRRRMGFLREDEGTMDSSDRIELMLKRGMGPREVVSEDTIYHKMFGRPRPDKLKEYDVTSEDDVDETS